MRESSEASDKIVLTRGYTLKNKQQRVKSAFFFAIALPKLGMLFAPMPRN
jgi:hypothetical protein